MSANRPEIFHLHFLTSIDEVDAAGISLREAGDNGERVAVEDDFLKREVDLFGA